MAQPRYRMVPVFVGPRKIAECNAVTYTIDSGDEQVYDANGVAGLTDGISTIKLEVDTVYPVSGTKIDLVGMMLRKEEFKAGILVGGKMHSFAARFTNASISSQSKTGTTTGKFTITAASNLDVS